MRAALSTAGFPPLIPPPPFCRLPHRTTPPRPAIAGQTIDKEIALIDMEGMGMSFFKVVPAFKALNKVGAHFFPVRSRGPPSPPLLRPLCHCPTHRPDRAPTSDRDHFAPRLMRVLRERLSVLGRNARTRCSS